MSAEPRGVCRVKSVSLGVLSTMTCTDATKKRQWHGLHLSYRIAAAVMLLTQSSTLHGKPTACPGS